MRIVSCRKMTVMNIDFDAYVHKCVYMKKKNVSFWLFCAHIYRNEFLLFEKKKWKKNENRLKNTTPCNETTISIILGGVFKFLFHLRRFEFKRLKFGNERIKNKNESNLTKTKFYNVKSIHIPQFIHLLI